MLKKLIYQFFKQNYSFVFLSDSEWIKIFSNEIAYEEFRNKVSHIPFDNDCTEFVDACFFISSNNNITRFKRILTTLKKNNVFYNFTFINYINLSFAIDKKLLNLNKNQIKKLKKDSYFIHYNVEDLIAVFLEYCIYFINKDYICFKDKNHYSCPLRINDLITFSNFKYINKKIYYLLHQLFFYYFENNICNEFLLVNFLFNFKKYKVKLNNTCINTIFTFINNEFISHPEKLKITKFLYYSITVIKDCYQLLPFNNQQKHLLKQFINQAEANKLLYSL